MKETGIIMSGDHPKLILDGIKTQTRRVMKPQPHIERGVMRWQKPHKGGMHNIDLNMDDHADLAKMFCPYGQVGDRLWVRETFAKRPLPSGGEQILYKAQFNELVEMLDLNEFTERMGYPHLKPSWKPSIHMFRKDSRITLEITEVREERVQEISIGDALAEGIEHKPFIAKHLYENLWDSLIAKHLYENLWDSLNAKRGYGWDANPWVWVISFKRME